MADDMLTKALEKIAFHEAEAQRLKIWVNEADKLNDQPPRFADLDLTATVAAGSGTTTARQAKRWSAGEFFNKPFSTAVRNIMVARFDAAGGPSPASVDDIHEALSQGSFAFETSGETQQKNSIRISLGKNSAAFVKLPNSDLFGLVEWYGKRAGKPGRKSTPDTSVPPGATVYRDDNSDVEESEEEHDNEVSSS
jgi:hypothetical protein